MALQFNSFIDIERLIHSLKTTIACLFGFFLAHFVGLNGDQWIVITIIVVMCAQIYVGSVITKAYLRFIGTLSGCLLGAFAIIFFGDDTTAIIAAISLSSFIFSYFATSQENLSYVGTLGAVTTAIIMLGQKPSVLFAVQRCLEISIGLFIATIVSQFILPIHARTHLKRIQAITLEQLREYYVTYLITRDVDTLQNEALDDTIVKSLTKQRQLAKESVREPLGTRFDSALFVQTLHAEREVLRSIDFMRSALSNIQNVDLILSQSTAWQTFNESILKTFNQLIQGVTSKETPKEPVEIPAMSSLKTEINKNLSTFSRENQLYCDGFLFAAEILSRNLMKLAALFRLLIKE